MRTDGELPISLRSVGRRSGPMADWSTAIANEFIKANGGPMPQMKTQKLVFIANGWNLAIANEPLVRDVAEAWDNGPVYRRIWDRIRDHGVYSDGRIVGSRGRPIIATELTDEEKAVIAHVWNKYGHCSASHLSALTHQAGTPWTRAYWTRGRNATIENADVREHYRSLALAGRAARA